MVDGVGHMLVEQLEIICATGVWDPGVSGVVHGDEARGRGEGSAREG